MAKKGKGKVVNFGKPNAQQQQPQLKLDPRKLDTVKCPECSGIFFDEGAHISHTKSNFFKKKFYRKNNLIKIINPKVISFYKGREVGYPINISLKKLNWSKKIRIILEYIYLVFQKKKY